MGGLISGILGGGQSSGQQAQMQGLHAARGDIQAYRPESMQARLNALRAAQSAYQGTNNALETLWGAPQTGQGTGGLAPQGAAPSPPRMLGHDMPTPTPATDNGHYTGQQRDPLAQFFDPAGIFGGKGPF